MLKLNLNLFKLVKNHFIGNLTTKNMENMSILPYLFKVNLKKN